MEFPNSCEQDWNLSLTDQHYHQERLCVAENVEQYGYRLNRRFNRTAAIAVGNFSSNNQQQIIKAMNKVDVNILILDDDPFMLKLLGHLISAIGYEQVSSYTNGHDALQAMEDPLGVPDVILLDINMPCMDGVEFVRHLAERQFSGHLILVSGEDELMLRATEKLAKSYKQSVQGRLQKPPKSNELALLLEKCICKSDIPVRSSIKQTKNYGPEALKIAIEQNQLINYYQPKVTVAHGELIGVETLVRWKHPEDGLVFPDRFIPVAEAYHLIDALTHTVIRNALQQAKSWLADGLDLRVAINISMDNLADLEFVHFLVTEAANADVPANQVVLEVTESRLAQDATAALDVLTRLRLNRFCLSIDDFGTGHSSLAQLRDFPFEELKIDRSFTHQAYQDVRLKAIFEASVELANHLDMQIVAEGVEDFADWCFLRHSGCGVAQGYFVGKPMPAENLASWLKEWQLRITTDRLLNPEF